VSALASSWPMSSGVSGLALRGELLHLASLVAGLRQGEHGLTVGAARMPEVDAPLFAGVRGPDPNLERPGPSIPLGDAQREPGLQPVPKLGATRRKTYFMTVPLEAGFIKRELDYRDIEAVYQRPDFPK
jgi:hypothetical protein